MPAFLLYKKTAVQTHGSPFLGDGFSVAAAGEEDDGKDDEPDPVVVEQIAEAVIHNRSSKKILR